jgi:hypothetical protein
MGSTARKTFTTAALALALSAAGWLVATPAHAAWKGVLSYEGGITQLCKAPAGNKVRVKVRMNNTKGKYWAKAGINRVVGGKPGNAWTYTHSAKPGKVSNVNSLRFAKGAKVYALVGSDLGPTDNRILKMSSIPRC